MMFVAMITLSVSVGLSTITFNGIAVELTTFHNDIEAILYLSIQNLKYNNPSQISNKTRTNNSKYGGNYQI